MTVNEFLDTLARNGDDLDSLGLIEVPVLTFLEWTADGVIHAGMFYGVPCFKGDQFLYQTLNREVKIVRQPTPLVHPVSRCAKVQWN